MDAALAAFLFGLLAGYVMLRLGRRNAVGLSELKLLRPLAWVLMTASFTLAIALLLWGLAGVGNR